jgi:phosphatidylglycerophosphatase A
MRVLARRLAELAGTGFYSGYFPIAPGTVGSIVAVAICIVFERLHLLSADGPIGWALLIAAVFAVGFPSARHLERRFGSDNKRIVIDEIWGMTISLALLPQSPGYLIGGFLLFRCFDIIKPFPARRAEKIGGGLGVMLDDGIVGVYANLALRLARVLVG